MNSFTHRCLALIVFWCALGGPLARQSRAEDGDVAKSEAAPRVSRWAPLVSESLRESGVGDLLAAQLANWEDVSLLERAELDKLVAELELTAADLVDPASAPKVGRLLNAEAILYLEQSDDAKANSLRLLALEARTGIPLAQWVVPRSDVEREADHMLKVLQRAHATLRLPDAKRRYVGIVAVHNEEVGPLLSPVAQSIAALAEQDLKATPGVVLLNRDLTFRLRSGERLTDDERLIRGATQLIELGLRREDSGYRISLVIRRPTAEPQSTFLVTASRELPEVRREVARALRGAIDAPHEVVRPPDPRREIEQLERAYVWLQRIGRTDESIPLAEALEALEPSPAHWREVRQGYERSAWRHHLESRNLRIGGQAAESSVELLLALQVGVQLEEWNRAAIEASSEEDLPDHVGQGSDPFFLQFDWVADESVECRALRERFDALRLQRFEVTYRHALRRKEPVGRLLESRLRTVGFYAKDAADFCRTFKHLVREIDALPVDIPNDDALPHGYLAAALQAIHCVQSENPPDFMRRPAPRWSREQLAPLTEFLLAGKLPLHQVLGNYLLCHLPDERGCDAARRVLDLQLALPADEMLNNFGSVLHIHPVGTLMRAGKLEEYAVELVRRIEAQPQVMLQHPAVVHSVVFNVRDEARGELCRRCLQCLEGQSLAKEDDERMASVRRRMRIDVEQLGLAKVASADGGAWKNYDVVELKVGDEPHEEVYFDTIAVALGADQRSDEMGRLWKTPRGQAGVSRFEVQSSKHLWTSAKFNYVDALADLSTGTLVLAPQAAFVATRDGVAMLHSDKVETFGPAEGAPGKVIHALAWFDDTLYVAYENCFASFDPRERRYTLLASASKVAGKHALDGGEGYVIQNIVSDPARRCLWFRVDATHGGKSPIGIWQYTPRTGEFRQVFSPPDYPYPWSNLTFVPDAINYVAGDKWWEIRLAAGEGKRRDDLATFREFNDGLYQVREFVRVGDVFFGLNGQCYTTDGKVHRHPNFLRWNKIVPCRHGFLAAGETADKWNTISPGPQRVWRVQPRVSAVDHSP